MFLFSVLSIFQPVFHNWFNKGYIMYCVAKKKKIAHNLTTLYSIISMEDAANIIKITFLSSLKESKVKFVLFNDATGTH